MFDDLIMFIREKKDNTLNGNDDLFNRTYNELSKKKSSLDLF